MANKTIIDVSHVAKLANLPLTSNLKSQLESSLGQVIDLVNHIQKLDTTGVEPTSQVTGLVNVLREDKVDPSRILTQEQALSNAKSQHNGYFMVDAILEN